MYKKLYDNIILRIMKLNMKRRYWELNMSGEYQ
jgi:hypothetical protein